MSFLNVLQLNIPEWPYILVGTICATINGAMQPVFAILFSKIITVGPSCCPWDDTFSSNVAASAEKKSTFCFHIAGVCRSRP